MEILEFFFNFFNCIDEEQSPCPFIVSIVLTAFHAFLTLALVLGVLFSDTRIQHIAILSTLLILLFGIRYNKGCCLTSFEQNSDKLTLTEVGQAFYLRDDVVEDRVFEEILVANLTLLHLIRIAVYSLSRSIGKML